MAGLTATFQAARREFWLFDDRAGLCHCGEVRRRLCLSVRGNFFRHLRERQLTWCLSLACISVVALAWMCRVTPPGYIMSDFLACGKISPVTAYVRDRALRNAGGQSSLDPHPRGRPCRVAKMFSRAFDSRRGLPSKKTISFRCSSGERTCSASVVDTRTQAHSSLTQHLHVHRPAVARRQRQEQWRKNFFSVYMLLSPFFFLSDIEMLKNIVFKFLLLDFVWRSPALTRSRFSWQRRFNVILRGTWGCNPISRHISKCPMHNSREGAHVRLASCVNTHADGGQPPAQEAQAAIGVHTKSVCAPHTRRPCRTNVRNRSSCEAHAAGWSIHPRLSPQARDTCAMTNASKMHEVNNLRTHAQCYGHMHTDGQLHANQHFLTHLTICTCGRVRVSRSGFKGYTSSLMATGELLGEDSSLQSVDAWTTEKGRKQDDRGGGGGMLGGGGAKMRKKSTSPHSSNKHLRFCNKMKKEIAAT